MLILEPRTPRWHNLCGFPSSPPDVPRPTMRRKYPCNINAATYPARRRREATGTEESARPGQHAASGQASPPAPLGYGEEASENTGPSGNAPDPVTEKFY